jgi:tetratricopeptide (TPR) repeat protein
MVFLRSELLTNSDRMDTTGKFEALMHLASVTFSNGVWNDAMLCIEEVESALSGLRDDGVSEDYILSKEYELMWLRVKCTLELGDHDACLDTVHQMKLKLRKENGLMGYGHCQLLLVRGKIAIHEGNYHHGLKIMAKASDMLDVQTRECPRGMIECAAFLSLYSAHALLDMGFDRDTSQIEELIGRVKCFIWELPHLHNPDLIARYFHACGIQSMHNGDMDSAYQHLCFSLRAFRTISNGKHPYVYIALVGLGEFYYRTGYFEEALRLYSKGYILLCKNLTDTTKNLEVARVMSAIGDVYLAQGTTLHSSTPPPGTLFTKLVLKTGLISHWEYIPIAVKRKINPQFDDTRRSQHAQVQYAYSSSASEKSREASSANEPSTKYI